MAAQDDPKTPIRPFLPKEPLDLPAGQADFPMPSAWKHTQKPAEPGQNQHEKDKQAYRDQNPHQIETLLEWSAPGRPFRRRSKQYYLTSILIMLLVEIILFLFSEFALMLVVASLVFVAFALATIPPRNFKYRISTEGITIEDHFFLWQELYDFYFKKREGIDVVHIRTHSFIPGELTVTLGGIEKERIKSTLLPYLPYREFIKPTFMEKSGDWLARNFPLENTRP
ncbi:MAG: hypothetical protein AAB583_05595 [Patescibacteria group bacterium]